MLELIGPRKLHRVIEAVASSGEWSGVTRGVWVRLEKLATEDLFDRTRIRYQFRERKR